MLEELIAGRIVNQIRVDDETRAWAAGRTAPHAGDHVAAPRPPGSADLKQRAMHYDYLILGSGIAGLYAALLASQHGRTAVVTKGPIEESNTKYAQGGIAAAVGPGDSVARHRQDTLTAGAGLCDPAAVDVLVREAPDRIRRLTELGVPFDSDEGRVALGREGAHSPPPHPARGPATAPATRSRR